MGFLLSSAGGEGHADGCAVRTREARNLAGGLREVRRAVEGELERPEGTSGRSSFFLLTIVVVTTIF
jgi:hypothetical protein